MRDLTLAVALVLAMIGSACTDSVATVDAEPTTTGQAVATSSSTSTTPSAPTEETDAPEADTERVLPSGPLYAPTTLPDGWEIQAFRYLEELEDSGGAVATSSFVVHRAGAGFETGGLVLDVATFADTDRAIDAARSPLGTGSDRAVDVAGLLDAMIEEDPTTGFRSLSGVARDRYLIQLYGRFPLDDLLAVVDALDIVDGRPVLGDGLPDWVIAPLGEARHIYFLDVAGPGGSVSVAVTPGRTRATLYLGGTDLEEELEGTNGAGYYAVQRIEEENLEFPSVHWWVPDVDLNASTGADLAVIVEILDAFEEVEPEVFDALIGDAAFEIIALEPLDPEPGPSDQEGLALDPALQARLVSFIEAQTGRRFDAVPTVSVVDADGLRGAVPEGIFVTEPLWEVLLALGLVEVTDDRLAADAARRERIRGVCCPISVIDTGDPAFNEVVIVHELTHGLDPPIDGVTAPTEVVDPALALIEGNAHRVAYLYVDGLDERGAAIADPPNVFPPAGDRRLPEPVRQILEFPYDEGLRFATALVEAGGEEAIVEAFARPPTNSEHILDPEAYLSGEEPLPVAAPDVPPDGTIERRGTLGAFLVKLLTVDQLGEERSLDLARAWAGDAAVVYRDGDELCIAAALAFDDPASAALFSDSVAAGGLDVAAAGETVSLTNCVSPSP